MKKSKLGIVTILLSIGIAVLGIFCYTQKKYLKVVNLKYYKFKKYYQMFNKWIQISHEKGSIIEQFHSKNIKTIAIYGNGEIGNRLYNELDKSDIQVLYIFDKSANDIAMFNGDNVKINSINDLMNFEDDIDCIIVTPVHEYEKIKSEIEAVSKVKVYSLEDILFN